MNTNETQLLYGEGVGPRTERVVEQVEVVKTLYASTPSCRLGVVGLTPGSGATFVALAVATAIRAKGIMPTVKEMYAEEIREIAGQSAEKVLQQGGLVTICDFSGIDGRKEWREQLKEMNKIVLVIDPLPSKIVKGFELYRKIKASGIEVVPIINKMQREVRLQEIKEVFQSKDIFEIPFVMWEYIYTAEKKAILAADIGFVQRQIKAPMERLLKNLLPKEILKLAPVVVE